MSDDITIKLCVTFVDQEAFYFKKPAPKLPPCVMWHEGVMLQLDEDGWEYLTIDGVVVNLDGTVYLDSQLDLPGGGWGDMAKTDWWESRGWVPRNQHE
jgi:hypothetical protein